MAPRPVHALGSPEWLAGFEAEIADFSRRQALLHVRRKPLHDYRFLPGNQARYLLDGRDQLAEMLSAIDQAQERIDVEMYIFRDDDVGQSFLFGLVAAALRGVRVRLLYDSIGCNAMQHSYFERLLEANGQVVEFHPLSPLRLRADRLGRRLGWRPTIRDHRKLLICDAAGPDGARVGLAITGGRNIGDEYMGREMGHGQWRDGGVVLQGPVVQRLGEVFDQMWVAAGGVDTPPPALHCPPAGPHPVMVLDTDPDRANALHWAMRRLALDARHSLAVSCAYFVPDGAWRRSLRFAARRNVDCRIIVPENSDVPIADAATRHISGYLLKGGVRIFHYASDILHAKELVYDEAVTIIGSSNIDDRSFRLNFELSVLVVGEAFARDVLAAHAADLKHSHPYTLEAWKNRGWWRKVKDWWWWQWRSQL